jgi:acetyl-CoA acyltransferase
MKDDIFILGVGMTALGKMPERSVKSLAAGAVSGALDDAGCKSADIEAAYFSNTTQSIIEGQHLIRGQIALRAMGFAGIPIINVENACASGSTALYQAVNHLRAGAAEVVLAVGAEKMYSADRAKSAAIFDGGWDVHESSAVAAGLSAIGEGVVVPPKREPGVPSPFMELYASLARGHMKRFGTTERQLAAVAAKNHHHSTMNPLSQYQNDMSIDEVLAGKLICWPLTLPMCSPISDGAAAVILCRRSALKRFGNARAIPVLACVLASGTERDWQDAERHLCRTAALKAYDHAGVEPSDISVAEVHDASAFAEIVQTENLGFCELGQGGWLAERGETSIGGRIPVNPSGGLESKGHPLGVTGLAQIYELVQQLRGTAGARQVDGARLAVAENGGGFIGVEEAAAVVTILGEANTRMAGATRHDS